MKAIYYGPNNFLAFANYGTDEENEPMLSFPEIRNPVNYPSRGPVARIRYQADGTIRAEYLPGIANYTMRIVRWLPWDRWKQTGEGIWLGATVTEEEADYIIRLTQSGWSEGGEVVVLQPGEVVEAAGQAPGIMPPESEPEPEPEPPKEPDPVWERKFECRRGSDQLMLF